LAKIEPPVKVTLEAFTLADPPQVLLAEPETSMPLGKVSVSGAVKFATLLLVLLKVMIRVETPPEVIVGGMKDLPSLGAMLDVTAKVATAGPVFLPLPVCNAPAPIELV